MKVKLLVFSLILFLPLVCFADNSSLFLDEIVVEEKASYESDKKSGFNTIITREEIERRGYVSLFNLLESENSVSIRSDTGSDKFSVIDLRGMGEASGSNVLIVVDDEIVNSSDMSAADLNDIPSSLIESVEIIRGSGGVLNGAGAVSGVIKIKTIAPEKNKALLNLNYGSHETLEKSLYISHKDKIHSVSLSSIFYDSQGYRENSFYEKANAHLKYENNFSDSVKFGLTGFVLKDKYGLPGGVSIDEASDYDKRKKTDFPFDNGFTHKKKINLNFRKNFLKYGTINITRGYSYKDNDYLMGYSPLISEEDQQNSISTVSKDLRISHDFTKDDFSFVSGVDCFFDDYVRTSRTESLRKNGQLDAKDFYFSGFLKKEKIRLNFGVRYSNSKSKFREDELLNGRGIKGDILNKDYNNNALELGITYTPFDFPMEFFSLFSKSYRNPNIDELGFSSGSLSPQQSLNYEIGLRFFSNSFLKAETSAFYLKTKDEIYYGEDDQGGKFNKNYESSTIRKGIDLNIKLNILKNLFAATGFSFIKAEFEDLGEEIPLVSDLKYFAFLEYEALRNLIFSVDYSYFSSKKQGSDIYGKLSRIPSYDTVDFALRYKINKFSFFIKSENIFNEKYFTSAYENTCYPMPERTFTAGIKAEF
ncbi:MAG: TonB-dependent receptor plug domain-containing protein [Desulfobacteraceae bacterium]|nr:TonB-dependent receptor plug domain-containing protein [Desulfobacteraceae bacterium]